LEICKAIEAFDKEFRRYLESFHHIDLSGRISLQRKGDESAFEWVFAIPQAEGCQVGMGS
jgi:hypothetical protein